MNQKTESQPQWIDIAVEVPDVGASVLVWDPTSESAQIDDFDRAMDADDFPEFMTYPDATHWMPLPAPPAA